MLLLRYRRRRGRRGRRRRRRRRSLVSRTRLTFTRVHSTSIDPRRLAGERLRGTAGGPPTGRGLSDRTCSSIAT